MSGTCVTTCRYDSDCSGIEKCCSDGCGRSCVLPEGRTPFKSGAHEKQRACFKHILPQLFKMFASFPFSQQEQHLPKADAERRCGHQFHAFGANVHPKASLKFILWCALGLRMEEIAGVLRFFDFSLNTLQVSSEWDVSKDSVL